MQENNPNFWLSRKFWYAVLGVAVLITLELTGNVDLTANQIMIIVVALISGHALTDMVKTT